MKKWIFRGYLILTLAESSLAAYLQFFHLRADSGQNPTSSIVSKASLILLGLAAAGIILGLILDFQDPPLRDRLARALRKEPFFWGMFIPLALIAVESGQNLLYFSSDLPADYFPFFLAENPLIIQWALAVSLQSLILLGAFALDRRREKTQPRVTWGSALQGMFVILVLLGLALAGTGFIARSSRIADAVGLFATTNAPLPLVQVVVVWIGFTAIWVLIRKLQRRVTLPGGDLLKRGIPFLVLWLAAFLVWSGAPITLNYHVDTPRAPNFQYNVASDSMYYEVQAQRLLAGEGFVEDVQHPLYAYILSGLHLVGGEHYQDIYPLQIALLALIPFLLYQLLSLLYSRYAGWLMAILFIIRERNSLLLGDTITVSNVQMLMTESVALLGVILTVYLITAWLAEPRREAGMPFLIGGVIGLLALMRIELLSLGFVFGLASLVNSRGKWGKWLRSSLVMACAVLVLVLPWMSRNWLETGSFYLDKSEFFRKTIQSYTSQIFLPQEATAPVKAGPEGEAAGESLSGLNRIWRHTTSSLSQSLLYLPSNHTPLAGVDLYLVYNPEKGILRHQSGLMFSDEFLTGYVKTAPYWDLAWDGSILPHSLLPLALSLLLVSAGFRALWERDRITALVPLLALAFHILTYSLFSRSGGRFVMVVDWVSLLYFSVGISCLTRRAWRALFQKDGEGYFELIGRGESASLPDKLGQPARLNRGIAVGIGLILVLGISMPIVERLVPPRYTEEKLAVLLEQIPPPVELDPSRQVVLYGKALYPGFFKAGENLLDDRSGRVPDSDQDRVMFRLVGQENIWVSLPADTAPGFFPHGSEVILMGNFTRNSEEDIRLKLQPFFLADEVYILNEGLGTFIHVNGSP